MRGDNPSPTVDLVFRKLFGSEENKDLLISLINSIMEPRLHLTDVVIKNPFNLAAYEGSKESIVDIKAMDQDGTWYGSEMQVHAHPFYGKRAIYYAARGYVDQLEAGQPYSSLNTSIGIHFLAFDLFADSRRMGADPELRAIYEAEAKAKMVELEQLQWAEKKGIEQGIAQGIMQGIEQGMERGMQHLLLRRMTRHIGEVPPRIEARLSTLTPDQLDDLDEALFDFNSYVEVEAWFSR